MSMPWSREWEKGSGEEIRIAALKIGAVVGGRESWSWRRQEAATAAP